MTAPAFLRQADITRVIRAAKNAGMVVTEVTVTADGALHISGETYSQPSKGGNQWADLEEI